MLHLAANIKKDVMPCNEKKKKKGPKTGLVLK